MHWIQQSSVRRMLWGIRLIKEEAPYIIQQPMFLHRQRWMYLSEGAKAIRLHACKLRLTIPELQKQKGAVGYIEYATSASVVLRLYINSH